MMGAVRFAVKRRLALGVLGGACGIAALFAIGCSSTGQAPPFETDVDVTPGEQNIGERIFVDTRWAQYFATHMTDVNSPLAVGDPSVRLVRAGLPHGLLRGVAREVRLGDRSSRLSRRALAEGGEPQG